MRDSTRAISLTMFSFVTAKMNDKGITVLVGILVMLLGPTLTSADVVREADKELTAYDCTVPLGLDRVFATGEEECEDLEEEEETTVNKTYLLLQRAERTIVEVQTCHMHHSAMGSYCGMHSHSVLIPSMFYSQRRAMVNATMCKKAGGTGNRGS